MKKSVLILSLFFSLFAHANFTLNGTTITQTGNDDTNSFITAMQNIGGGVTVSTYGNTTHSTFHIIDFAANSLYVDGNLDIDFNRMTFIFTGTDATERLYSRNGSIRLKSDQVVNGFNFNPVVGTVIFAIENNPVNWNSQTLRVNNAGGKSEFKGVIFKGEFSAWIYGNARFENCVIEKIGNNGDIQFNVQGDTELVDIKKYDDGQTGITFRADSRNVLVSNVRVFGARDSFNNESNFSVTIEKLDSDVGSTADISQFGGRRHVVKNAKNGTRFLWANHLNGGNSTNYNSGSIEVIQELTAKVVDLDGNPVAGAVLYIEDNPQLAVADNTTHVLQVFDNQNAQVQRIYTEMTDANGNVPTFDVLIGEGKSRGGDPNNGRIRGRGRTPIAYFFNQPEPDDIFDYGFVSYRHNIVFKSIALKGVESSEISDVLTDDNSITEPNIAVANAYTGINIDHTAKTITVSENRTLCELYDFIKADKVLNNIQFPTPSTLAAESQGTELFIGDYKFEITGTAVLSPCDKFLKLRSNVTSAINDPNTNLSVALTDDINTYKLIQISNIVDGDVAITDENTGTVLKQEVNYNGVINLVTQNNSDKVSLVVLRDGYSNWATTIDLSSTIDRFAFSVAQSDVLSSCSLSNQEESLYLLRKILQKNQAIQSFINDDAVPNITLNSVNQTAIFATEEKQIEMIEIIKRILSKTQAIRTSIED